MPNSNHTTPHIFNSSNTLAVALAEQVRRALCDGIGERGMAVLAVSGGTTPVHFFEQLSRAELDWSRVIVTLVDERWVSEDSERSNAHLVRSHLLQHAAGQATFVPLHTAAATPEAGQRAVAENIAALPLPFDVVVLGMGSDGHTASFLPDGDHLQEAIDLSNPTPVWPMRAPGVPEPRITLSLSTLLQTRNLFLLFEGEAKRAVFAQAQLGMGAVADCPVRAVLEQTEVPVAVYWCP